MNKIINYLLAIFCFLLVPISSAFGIYLFTDVIDCYEGFLCIIKLVFTMLFTIIFSVGLVVAGIMSIIIGYEK